MTKKCQVDEKCPTPAQTLLITACITPHLTETLTCQTHLQTLSRLHQQNKLYCHCGKPIITAMYKHKTTIRNLNEENNP